MNKIKMLALAALAAATVGTGALAGPPSASGVELVDRQLEPGEPDDLLRQEAE